MKLSIYLLFFTLLCSQLQSQVGDTEIQGNLFVRGSIIQGSEIQPGVQVFQVLSTNPEALSLGATNHFSGWSAGYQISNGNGNGNGDRNSAFGNFSQYDNTTGRGNTSMGLGSGLHLTGFWNTNVGHLSGFNISSSFNAFFGNWSGRLTTTGEQNTFVGSNSGDDNTTGSWNTFLGSSSGSEHKLGDHNVYIGSHTGRDDAGGSQNVFIGANTDAGISNCSNSVAIGYNVHPNGSNRVVIGNSGINSIGGYSNWSNLSDKRFKENIKNNVPGLDLILRLNPVTYNLKVSKITELLGSKKLSNTNEISTDKEDTGSDLNNKYLNTQLPTKLKDSLHKKAEKSQTGLIAQEVEEVIKDLNFDFSGLIRPQNEEDHYRLSYSEFVVPLIKAVQEQQQMIETLQEEVERLKKRN